jgi:colicin import membrane protein
MRNLILILTLSMISTGLFAQSKKEVAARFSDFEKELSILKRDVELLKLELSQTKESLSVLSGENERLRTQLKAKESVEKVNAETTVQKTQCQATTAKGTQCSRTASAGSDFCWQHQNSQTQSTSKTQSATQPATQPAGRTIHTGPRGGQYYINSSGKKVYIKR